MLSHSPGRETRLDLDSKKFYYKALKKFFKARDGKPENLKHFSFV